VKSVAFCFAVSIITLSRSLGQPEPALTTFSRDRANHFKLQLDLATSFARKTNRPLRFKDNLGNVIHLVGVSANGLPIYLSTLNADAALTTGAVQLQSGGTTGLNILGEGMLVGVWDAGIVADHIELGNRVIAREGSEVDSHSTHVTGTLIATGINPDAKGMAPLAEATTHDFDNDEAEMAALAKPDQTSLLLSSHSYGTLTGWYKSGGIWNWTGDPTISQIEDYRFGFYDTRAQDIDKIASMAPYYSIVWATGNDRADVGTGTYPPDCNGGSGYDCIIPEAVSKNIITVGAVNEVANYTNPFDVVMSFFSSWGPTDDGRIKPDLVGDGVNVFSLSATGTNSYAVMSGTSMATPNVAGSLLLVQELYSKLHGGNFMRAATVKALAIHTAKEAGNFPGPDYSFGWGLLDVAAAGKLLTGEDGQNIIIREATLQNGSIFQWPLQPKANQKITATIAWTDPPGIVHPPALDPTTLALVNDLDLRIIDDQGNEQVPWVLDPSNPSLQASTGDNFRDNVEKLEFNFPLGKAYTLVVRHKGTLTGGQQDFSLMITYQSTAATKTFYWVGDSGNWNDGSHWSLSTGGSPASQIPGPSDRVIVDENSFDGIGTDGITLTQAEACGALTWINSKPSGLSLQGNTLTISSAWKIATPDFYIQTSGVVSLNASGGTGQFFTSGNDLTGLALLFDGGTWTQKGDFKLDQLNLNADSVFMNGSTASVGWLYSQTPVSKTWILQGTTINLLQSSTIDGTSLGVISRNSTINIASGSVLLAWQSVNFPGSLAIATNAGAIINGNNTLGNLMVNGKVTLNGSCKMDTLNAQPGAMLQFGSATVQTVLAQTLMTGSLSQPITLQGASGSTIQFTNHDKLCFDYLSVSNVSATGLAVVNAGVNSVLSNAPNWQQKACSDVVFADFDSQYNCVKSLTQFENKSQGNGNTNSWKFNGSPTISAVNPEWQFPTQGTFPVSLLVSDGVSRDSVTKNISIRSNSLSGNQVIASEGMLTSLQVADGYQWYRNGVALSGAINRSYNLSGSSGLYYVVIFDQQCNLPSDSLTISGLEQAKGIVVYPNPASDYIKIVTNATADHVVLTDLLGRTWLDQMIYSSEEMLSVRQVPDGIYILRLMVGEEELPQKLVVHH
jgi:Subtilase family/Secretion system C-terminal sorting domain